MDAVAQDLAALARAHAALSAGDSMVARRWLASVGNVFAEEIDSLIRQGRYEDATERLHRYLNPKFSTVAECEAHVGSSHHLDSKRVPL
ncbi:hypothetical protein CQ13_06300 [Bradyrhizobium retamae]|uniref:Uncharacterized protein n=2 Tax=Bradyrhizobium retamae TaxID=1300035 RepID=A0A0R3MP98_9BRAD|nr:hypothetical protein CQ13_06300 [Bradyrhizobium retamae]